MKLEVGKYYEGVDGNKYGPMERVRRNVIGENVNYFWQEAECISSHIWKEDGTSEWSDDPNLVAEWEEEPMEQEPVLWKDMTPEEKGALLLAHLEGEPIEFWCVDEWHEFETSPSWIDNFVYRVKPKEPKREFVYRVKPKEPKRETVDLWWDGRTASNSYYAGTDTHKITFDTIDGKPECDSIKMEEY